MTMQLKEYQQRTLARVDDFLRLCKLRGISAAYAEVARRKGEDEKPENSYAGEYRTVIAGLDDCPHVCMRIPTGGGKTLLAAHSIPLAAEFTERPFPVVLWMIPWDNVRTQTAKILKDPLHPCRAFLDGKFGHQVAVYDIADFDSINAATISGKACVVVSTIQAFRSRQTELRRVYAHNEALDSHFAQLDASHLADEGLERDKGEVKHSFANLLRVIRPVVILDEAHNVVTPLSHETILRFRPSCILEFTATPREENYRGELQEGFQKHNILVNVPAQDLREAQMIKLPIRLTEHGNWRDAVNAAVLEQRRLEEIAREAGESIRPIVLYQAESRIEGNANRVTWDVLHKHLAEVELGEESKNQIAVATGDRNDLEGKDLMSPDCEIRHVITVQALREGWDCPFAYTLCSVANVSNEAAIEQIMGRVLRMPYARERSRPELNLAYAHVVADNFAEVANALCKRMAGRMGFEESEMLPQITPGSPQAGSRDGRSGTLYGVTLSVQNGPDFSGLDNETRKIAERVVETKPNRDGGVSVVIRDEVPESALSAIMKGVQPEKREKEEGEYRRFVRELDKNPSPARRGVKFAALPRWKFKSGEDGEICQANRDNFYQETEWNTMGAECELAAADFSIDEQGRVFVMDVEDGKVQYEKLGEYRLPLVHEDRMDEKRLVRWLEGEVRDSEGRYVPETLRKFVRRNLEALFKRDYSLAQLARAKYPLAHALRQNLEAHGKRALAKSARRILFDDPGALLMDFDFEFPTRRLNYGKPYSGGFIFKRHYYWPVEDLATGGEEFRCAQALDSLEKEVRHWIRNVQQKPWAYYIPLSDGGHFYPDFVAELQNGKVLVVEYKGEDRLLDARVKLKCGNWLEETGRGRVFFLMTTEEDGKPSVEAQIRAKIAEIMAA